MGKKDKAKKVNAKKEKYTKFKKDKPKTLDITSPEPSVEEIKQRQDDEMKLSRYWRFSKNPPTKEIKDKKLKYK